jgi:ribose 5-phosphate isomerase B
LSIDRGFFVFYYVIMHNSLPHVYIGSDHGGFSQKELIINSLRSEGYTITDCGTYSSESTDYPDFAVAVGVAVQSNRERFGVLLCRSGEGMEMAANKVKKIRAALVWKVEVAVETRRDNDANILVLPSDFVSNELALAITRAFLSTPFSGEERHIHRIEKLHAIEHTTYES